MNNTPTLSLESLAAAFEQARREEESARQARLAIEEQIVRQMAVPDEGTVHAEAGHWRVTVTAAVRRTVDPAILQSVADQVPAEIGEKLIRWKPDLVLKELRAVQKYSPDVYQVVAQAITAKPAKPTVKVQLLDEEAA